MTRTRRGFLLMEMLAGIAILAGIVCVVLVALGGSGEVVALDAERAAAASRLGEVLDGAHAGDVAVHLDGETRVERSGADAALRGETWVIKAERWTDDPSLTKLTARVEWCSSQRIASVSAQTLVRTSRLKAAGGAP